MWIRPPVLLILCALAITGYSGYIFYQTWFNIDKLHARAIKSTISLPSWFPFKQYYSLRLQNKKSWIIERKIMNIFMTLFVLLFDSLIVMAVIYGK